MAKIDMDKLGMAFVSAQIDKEKFKERKYNDYSSLFVEYKKMCSKDTKFMELQNDYNELKHINLYGTFVQTFKTVTKYQRGIFAEDDIIIKEFNKQLLNDAKNWAENIDSIKQEANKKIQKIESKFGFFKKSKIAKIQDELKRKQYWVNEYNYCLQCENRKEEIISKYGSEEKLQRLFENKQFELAEKAFNKHIMDYPYAICDKQTGFLSTSEIDNVKIASGELNKVINSFRKDLKDYLVEVNEQNANKTKNKEYEL